MGTLLGIAVLFTTQFVHAETLRIASWNIEHLVANTGGGCRPRGEADFQRVRDVIAQVDATSGSFRTSKGSPRLPESSIRGLTDVALDASAASLFGRPANPSAYGQGLGQKAVASCCEAAICDSLIQNSALADKAVRQPIPKLLP